MRCNECDREYNEEAYIYCPFCSEPEMLDDGDMPMYTNEYDEVPHVNIREVDEDD